MTNQQDTALLPCPLCGGEADIARPGCKGSLIGAGCWGPGHIAYAVGETREEAIAAWNKRAEQAKPSASCEAGDARDLEAAREIVEWWNTGILPGTVLRTMADEMIAAGRVDELHAVRQAENAVVARIVRAVLAQPKLPSCEGEEVERVIRRTIPRVHLMISDGHYDGAAKILATALRAEGEAGEQ